MEIPKGHQALMPYLIVEDADGFFGFMEKVFGAELTYPAVRPEKLDGHCELGLAGSTIMFAKSGGEWTPRTADLFVYVENADETYGKAIENGASEVLPLSDQDYGRSGGVKDAAGNIWWITSVQKEEQNG
jgi:uncharacterized glyoxalase superfamily protein PhnB